MGDNIGPDGSTAGDDCRETIARLYVYLDGELTEDRRREIEAHLDECSPCLSALEFESELRRVIADHCRDRVPEALRERVAGLISSEQAGTGSSS